MGQVETGASVALNAAGAAVEAALHSVRIEQLLATVRAHGFEYVQFVERAVHVTSEYTPPGLPPLQLSPPPSPTRCLMGISALWCVETINDQALGTYLIVAAACGAGLLCLIAFGLIFKLRLRLLAWMHVGRAR